MSKIIVAILIIVPICLSLQNQSTTVKTRKSKVAHCTTPNGDLGKCLDIQECPTLTSAKVGKKLMQNSRCGKDKSKVCCGKHHKGKLSIKQQFSSKDLFSNICGNQTLLQIARIVGGKGAAIGEFPWMARLKHKTKFGYEAYGCVGFLISERFVVTAAHCILSKSLGDLGPLYGVQLGEHNTERDPDCLKFAKRNICAPAPQVLRTAKPIVHPEYTENLQHYNDIAVIPLKDTANFTKFVYPICLSNESPNEQTFWLSGWGKTDYSTSSANKRKVSIMKTSQDRCRKKYQKVGVNLRSSQICAGGQGGRDSCSGDSGGPLMVHNGTQKWYAVGVVSFGLGCGLQGWPGIYTDIPHHFPWILKVTNRYLKKHVNL